MADKILNAAMEYCKQRTGKPTTDGKNNIDGLINDAANIFASNYDEYLTIWSVLEKLFK